jgi:hypothetical protein
MDYEYEYGISDEELDDLEDDEYMLEDNQIECDDIYSDDHYSETLPPKTYRHKPDVWCPNEDELYDDENTA